MILTRKSVELLAPAGTWDALVADVESGADAVYLGGKHFNMRMHEGDFNFDDAALKKAIDYAHAHDVRLYITLNNLISDEELPALKEYLQYLEEIQPDALLVQDFAVLELVHEMGITIPLHTSVMMNTHNEHAIEKLKEYGITRIVVGREMTLSELALFRARTGIEVEYFMHGDMCISESGQCIHSGVVFGQSGNRGRCLKPCRWAYELIDEKSGKRLDEGGPGPYKLALKDMCMYPQLIQAGVFSFKIEGRMRPAPFLRRIVSTYRAAIDAYIADPTGYATDEEGWKQLYENRARDFTTTFAFGQPTAKDIGFDGTREPRFFSEAVKEAGFQDDILKQERPIQTENASHRTLAVRVGTPAAAKAAVDAGADVVYVGGEAFRPQRPWRLTDYAEVLAYAQERNVRVVLNTPRTTMRRECGELEQLFSSIRDWKQQPAGIMVSNLGALKLAQSLTTLPVQADLSFNLFNHLATVFMKDNGITQACASLELSFEQLREIVENAVLPIEVVIHGGYESMICDHNFPAMSLPDYNELNEPELMDRHYALRDKAGEIHRIRIDQFGRNHIYFAKDLCLYPYLAKFNGIASYRIEAQDETPASTAMLTKIYRKALDRLAAGDASFDEHEFKTLQENAPRGLGIGTYRFRESRNSI